MRMQYTNMNGFLNHSNQFLTTEKIGKGTFTVFTL